MVSPYFSKFYIFNNKSILSPGCPQALEGHNLFVPFLSLGHFSGGAKMTIFETKSDEIQTSANMN